MRVVNVHLDTRINSKDRVAQLAPVIDMLDAIDGPQILGGDFNTMDVGWLHTMWPFPYFQHQVAARAHAAGRRARFTRPSRAAARPSSFSACRSGSTGSI